MRRNFNLAFTVLIVLMATIGAFAQEDVKYKDVILDGKPAKLNMSTGEITLVVSKKNEVKKKSEKVDSNPILVTNSTVISGSSNPETIDEESTPDFHIVKEGENLFRISKKYNISLSELKAGNNLKTTLIKKGQKLRIRNFDEAEELVAVPSVWTVSKGDTLYSIAKKNGITVEAIKSLNGLIDNTILIGQILRLK